MISDIRQIWCGGHTQKPSLRLAAGRINMLYENGNLRYISAGSDEIIRMIYPAVRDKGWLTVKPVITYERIERLSDSFRIEHKCNYRHGEIDFSASYSIEGKPDNTIIFILDGEALESFEKNRLGFCVLHPMKNYRGNPCKITHTDGNTELCHFPSYVSPHQPFLDIKSMNWKTGDSDCSLLFSGDIFETEDQRNWTDGSFKTYSTPLSLPFPVRMKKGQKIHQEVEFRCVRTSQVADNSDENIKISFKKGNIIPFPEIGIGCSSRELSLSDNEKRILKLLNFDHYRCEIFLFDQEWKNKAENILKDSGHLNCSLELVVFFDDRYKDQIAELIAWLIAKKPPVSVITLLHKTIQVTPSELIKYAVPFIRESVSGVRICCGTNANFAQLNRKRPAEPDCDLLCYSVHPQEHASDNSTLIENLQAQSYPVETAQHFLDGKGIWVSPVNLQRRFNANLENFENRFVNDVIPYQVDSRQMSLFGACWATGSLKYNCESGASGITYFETVGERGIIQGDCPSGWPEKFHAPAGMIFPVFHVFNWMLKNKSCTIMKSVSSSPLNADILTLTDGNKVKAAIINPTSVFQKIVLDGCSGIISLIKLDTDTFESATSDPSWVINAIKIEVNAEAPLILTPFSVTFIDGIILH